MKTTLEIMLDNIAKKNYGELYKYCTKKEQMQCLIYLDQDLKIQKEKNDVEKEINKFCKTATIILFFGILIMAIVKLFGF